MKSASTASNAASNGASTSRKPRLLWANTYCLLDTSSGASVSVREMLLQLVGQGYEVHIVGATIFDHDRGGEESRPQWAPMKNRPGSVAMLSDGPLLHHLLVTANTRRSLMTSFECIKGDSSGLAMPRTLVGGNPTWVNASHEPSIQPC